MEQKVQADKLEIEMNNRATEMIIEQDRQFLEQEKQRQIHRAKLLLQITAANKEVNKNNIFCPAGHVQQSFRKEPKVTGPEPAIRCKGLLIGGIVVVVPCRNARAFYFYLSHHFFCYREIVDADT